MLNESNLRVRICIHTYLRICIDTYLRCTNARMLPWHFPQRVFMSDLQVVVGNVQPVVGHIQVIFADNHPLTLSGLRSAVADHSDIQVLAECNDRERVLEAVRSHLPDLLLLRAELLQAELKLST